MFSAAARRRLMAACLLMSCLPVPVFGADDRPLPEVSAFAAEVRKRLLADRELQTHYTYIERRESISVSKLGKVTEGPVKEFEVYPSAEAGNTYKRLIAVNGVPLPPAELAERDRKHRDDLVRDLEKRRQETPGQRAARLRTQLAEHGQDDATLNELFRLYTITLIGREVVDGYPVIVAALEPRRTYRPETDTGKMLQKFHGRAWVSESDYQLAKVDMEANEDLTVAWGLVGRVHKGARLIFERKKVNDEVWLPARLVLQGSGQTLLFRHFEVNAETTYSQYRRIEPTAATVR
jgi:hypothetical protein